MENTASNIPIWKLVLVLQTMLEEGYTLVDMNFHDDKTISMRPSKEEPKEEDRPDINKLMI